MAWRMRSRFALMLTVLPVVVASGAPASAARPRYEITAIIEGPTCGSGAPAHVFPLAMNAGGDVVGYTMCPGSALRKPFVWRNSVLTPIPMPPGIVSGRANDINDAGQIAATLGGWANPHEAYRIEDGVLTALGTIPGGTSSWGYAIADDGTVVGRAANVATGPSHAALWEDQELFDLGAVLSGEWNSEAIDQNASGQVAGTLSRAFPDQTALLWHDGVTIEVGPVPRGVSSTAMAMNDRGDIVGWGRVLDDAGFSYDKHAFIWADGTIVSIDGLGFTETVPLDVNDRREIVGYVFGPGTRPFIWVSGCTYDLNDLVNGSEIVLHAAYGITESSQIIARGRGTGPSVVAVMLSPVPVADADLNDDCVTNELDLGLLLTRWATADPVADLDKDGLVGFADLLILLGLWSLP